MEKLDPKTDGARPDIVEQNIEMMKELCPDVFTEGKVDLDALRETLGDYADERQERYSFTWNGKARARRMADPVMSKESFNSRPKREWATLVHSSFGIFQGGRPIPVILKFNSFRAPWIREQVGTRIKE